MGERGYLTFQRSEQEAGEDLARFVAVADVFEGFGCVLAADVEEDFFAAAVGGGRGEEVSGMGGINAWMGGGGVVLVGGKGEEG